MKKKRINSNDVLLVIDTAANSHVGVNYLK